MKAPMQDIVEEYGIDKETFKAAMDENIIDWVTKALECELLTQDQVDRIAAVMRQGPPEMSTEE